MDEQRRGKMAVLIVAFSHGWYQLIYDALFFTTDVSRQIKEPAFDLNSSSYLIRKYPAS